MAFLILILPKFYQMITASVLFFGGISVLYFGFNSLFVGLSQLFIYIFGIVSLLIIGYNATKQTDGKKPRILDKKFFLCIITFTVILVSICLLVYYFSKVPDELNILFQNKNEYPRLITFFATAETLFKEYFLAYGLVIIAFISVLTGVSILIAKEKKLKNNEKKTKEGKVND